MQERLGFHGFMPDIIFSKDREVVLWEISDMWPFSSPEELIFAICKYLKLNMKYDFFYLLGMTDLEPYFKWNIPNKEKYEKMKNVFSKVSMISEAWWNALQKVASDLSERNDVDSGIKNTAIKLLTIISADADSDVRLLQIFEAMDDSEFLDAFRAVVAESYDNELDKQPRELVDIVKHQKVWVCRHYAVIAKVLFESLSSTIGSKDLWVMKTVTLDGVWAHIYNVLLTINPKTKRLQAKYFDITKFIIDPNAVSPVINPTKDDLKREFWAQWVLGLPEVYNT